MQNSSMKIINGLPAGTLLHGKQYEYEIVRPLGQGTFGITYLANVKMKGELGTLSTSVQVAVKEFFMKEVNGRKESTVTSSSHDGAFDYYKLKFIKEAQNLGSLKHPGIIKVIEAFEENNTAYYVMEYLEEGSLDEQIERKKGASDSEWIWRNTGGIGEALAYMHRHHMLHLDLKPGNIMINKAGNPVLIDFGLSKRFDENGEPDSTTSVGQGTPGYAPLEQSTFNGSWKGGFPASMDIYALGATMFKMATGRRPPEAHMILNDGFPIAELEKSGAEPQLIEVIEKAMKPLKKDRYQNLNELLKDLPAYSRSESGKNTGDGDNDDSEEVEIVGTDLSGIQEVDEEEEYRRMSGVKDDFSEVTDGRVGLRKPADPTLSPIIITEPVTKITFLFVSNEKSGRNGKNYDLVSASVTNSEMSILLQKPGAKKPRNYKIKGDFLNRGLRLIKNWTYYPDKGKYSLETSEGYYECSFNLVVFNGSKRLFDLSTSQANNKFMGNLYGFPLLKFDQLLETFPELKDILNNKSDGDSSPEKKFLANPFYKLLYKGRRKEPLQRFLLYGFIGIALSGIFIWADAVFAPYDKLSYKACDWVLFGFSIMFLIVALQNSYHLLRRKPREKSTIAKLLLNMVFMVGLMVLALAFLLSIFVWYKN